MNKTKQLQKELEEIENEFQIIFKRCYDYKRHCWKKDFNVTEWNYYKEFWGKAFYKEWEDKYVECYLNFLNSRVRNIKCKINQIKWKNFGKY